MSNTPFAQLWRAIVVRFSRPKSKPARNQGLPYVIIRKAQP